MQSLAAGRLAQFVSFGAVLSQTVPMVIVQNRVRRGRFYP